MDLFLKSFFILLTAFLGVITLINFNKKSKPHNDEDDFTFKTKTQELQHFAIWDRTTCELPSLTHLQKYNFEKLYFCTTEGEQPDLTLIRPASKAKKIVHWEYRTDRQTHLQIYSLFALLHIKLNSDIDKKTIIHVFTNSEALKQRFLVHGLGYEQTDFIFKREA